LFKNKYILLQILDNKKIEVAMLYKKVIKRRIRNFKRKNPSFRYSALADQLQIEPSYLSRFLSDDKVHFSDELLFRMLNQLGSPPIEQEQIILLREINKTSSEARRVFLLERLRSLKVKTVRTELDLLKKDLLDLIAEIKQTENLTF
jgi:hypothetical protein